MQDRDIVDRIELLVENQLGNFERRSGYDVNVNQEICPHCRREWHGLPITLRMQQMRHIGRFDENYRYAEDRSRVLCAGSTFIGPMPRERPVFDGFDVFQAWLDLVTTACSTPESMLQETGVWFQPAGSPPSTFGVAGGLTDATWRCPVCDKWARVRELGVDPNSFAAALRNYAAHVGQYHEAEYRDLYDACDFAIRFGLPRHGVLWDREYHPIGLFGPEGTSFRPGSGVRDLRGFTAELPDS